METQHQLRGNQYPKTLNEAVKLLNNRTPDKAYQQSRNNRDSNKEEDNGDDKKQNEDTPELSFAQQQSTWKFKCWCCGKPGHMADKCNQKESKPHSEWAIHKTIGKDPEKEQSTTQEQSHLNSEDRNTQPTETNQKNTSDSNTITGWAGYHSDLSQPKTIDKRNVVMLDNQSDVSIFCNEELVEDIRLADKPLHFGTDTGNMITNQEATLPGFGPVWFNKDTQTNILAFAKVEEKHDISYDKLTKTFMVQYDDNTIAEFKNHGDGFHYYKPTERYKAFVKERKRLAGVQHKTITNSKFTGVDSQHTEGWTMVKRKTRYKQKGNNIGICPIDRTK